MSVPVEPPDPVGPAGWTRPAGWQPPPAAPDPTRPAVAVLAGIAVAAAVLGVPFGLLWSVVAPDVPVRVTDAGLVYADPQPEQLAAADGWFAILAVPFGVLAAAGVWLATRRRGRGIPALLALTAGMITAGGLAWWVGRQIGLSGYRDTLAAAPVGAFRSRPPDLSVAEVGWWPPHVLGVLLVPALAAAATYTLLAAWSQFPRLHPDGFPGPRPDGATGGLAAHPLDLTGAEPDRPAGT